MREGKGLLLVFGPVIAIMLLLGLMYRPAAYDHYWAPFERASCVSADDGETAVAAFDRAGSLFKLRSGSDAGKLVHQRQGTGDWKCRRVRG